MPRRRHRTPSRAQSRPQSRTQSPTQNRVDQSGIAAIELTLLAPVLLLILLFVVGLGRMAHARQDVEAAAADSARAASLQRNPAASRAAAEQAAQRSVGDGDLSCEQLNLQLDLSGLRPGGTITAVVQCRASLADVALSGLPGSRTFTATSRVPIETYRGR